MDAQREMTLDEWVGTLPPIHHARTELDIMRRQLAEAEKSRDYARQLAADASIKFAETAAKLALAEQDGKRLDYMLHWHATTLTDGDGWRVAFEYTSPATYATIKKYQTQREAIDAAITTEKKKEK